MQISYLAKKMKIGFIVRMLSLLSSLLMAIEQAIYTTIVRHFIILSGRYTCILLTIMAVICLFTSPSSLKMRVF